MHFFDQGLWDHLRLYFLDYFQNDFLDCFLDDFRDDLGNNFWSLDQDVAPDFLAESQVVSVHKSEEGTVLAWELGSHQGKGDSDFVAGLDEVLEFEGHCFQVVTIRLDEEGVYRPLGVSSVSEGPLLHNLLLRKDLVSVSVVLLHESGLVDGLILAMALAVAHPLGTHLHIHVGVLTLDEGGSLLSLADLEHRVGVALLLLTLLAEVEVRAHTALVSDTLDRSGGAAITSNATVDSSCLVCGFLAEVVNHQALEGLGGVGLHFFFEDLDDAFVEVALKFACAVAPTTRQAFLVDLGAVTSEAGEFVFSYDLFLFLLRSEDLTVDFLFSSFYSHLVALVLSCH